MFVVEPHHRKTVCFKLIAIGKSVPRFKTRPFSRQLKVFCAVEAQPIVIFGSAPAEDGLSNATRRSMIDCHLHVLDYIITKILLSTVYYKVSIIANFMLFLCMDGDGLILCQKVIKICYNNCQNHLANMP